MAVMAPVCPGYLLVPRKATIFLGWESLSVSMTALRGTGVLFYSLYSLSGRNRIIHGASVAQGATLAPPTREQSCRSKGIDGGWSHNEDK